MNSESVNRWLALTVNLSVVAGIILLALELRQTNDAILAATYQERANSGMEWEKFIADSEYVAPAILHLREVGMGSTSPCSLETAAPEPSGVRRHKPPCQSHNLVPFYPTPPSTTDYASVGASRLPSHIDQHRVTDKRFLPNQFLCD